MVDEATVVIETPAPEVNPEPVKPPRKPRSTPRFVGQRFEEDDMGQSVTVDVLSGKSSQDVVKKLVALDPPQSGKYRVVCVHKTFEVAVETKTQVIVK